MVCPMDHFFGATLPGLWGSTSTPAGWFNPSTNQLSPAHHPLTPRHMAYPQLAPPNGPAGAQVPNSSKHSVSNLGAPGH